MSESEIRNWYANKNVLVTGATGFVGKVLVESILRHCDDVNCVYLIIRGMGNFDARCQAFLKQTAFDFLRVNKPAQLQKIKCFQGDLSQENLGLSWNNLTEILDNIDIVVHSGADVKFGLPLRDLFSTNTIGTYRFLEIAKQIKRLQVFVYVSTAYSQSHQNITAERHYEGEIDVFTLMKAFERFDDQTMVALQPKLLKEFPNTYSFSKHLSEDIVHKYRVHFPICVVRPSVVCSAINHPIPGYTEGLHGINGWFYASMRGVLRTTFTEKEAQIQVIPVDVVANTIIATSWIHGTKKVDHIEYYTANMLNTNLMSIEKLFKIGKPIHFKTPLNYSVWSPNYKNTKCAYYYYIRIFLYQILLSGLLDGLIWVFRRKPIMLKIQRRIHHGLTQIFPYLKVFTFKTVNFQNVRNYLSQEDNEIFVTNIDDFTMNKALPLILLGIRKFIAKEKDEDLPKARQTVFILHLVHITMQIIVSLCLLKYLYGKLF